MTVMCQIRDERPPALQRSVAQPGRADREAMSPIAGWCMRSAAKALTVPVALLALGFAACGGGSGSGSVSNQGAGSSGGGSSGGGSSGGSSGAAQIVVDAASKLASISTDEIGTNLAVWYDVTAGDLPAQLALIKPRMLRWPGGSTSDTYHWQNHSECAARGSVVATWNPNSTFDNFMSHIVMPGAYHAAVTVNYGSNSSCTAGAEPAEAAAWVAHAKAMGYNAQLQHWTVGNEVYGGWEFDLHPKPNDPATYAAAVAGAGGFYQMMKAADASAQIGVVAFGGGSWDSIVLNQAPYDFVELHWYAQQPGAESDSYLLHEAPAALGAALRGLQGELAAAGRGGTPIMLGEFNSVTYNPGKQSTSIVNALFTGMAFGEVLNANVALATWWFGAGATQLCGTNDAASLYGWQNFGGYDLVAANTVNAWNGCGNGTLVPEGTVFPSGNAFALVAKFAVEGNHMLNAAVAAALPDVRAYAATQGSGYALLLFNLASDSASTVTVGITSAGANSFTATTSTYGKAQYDDSRNNLWSGPQTASLGSVGTTLSVTLPAWSMTLLQLQ